MGSCLARGGVHWYFDDLERTRHRFHITPSRHGGKTVHWEGGAPKHSFAEAAKALMVTARTRQAEAEGLLKGLRPPPEAAQEEHDPGRELLRVEAKMAKEYLMALEEATAIALGDVLAAARSTEHVEL